MVMTADPTPTFFTSVLTANASDPIMIEMPMACVQRPIA